jgi:DNA-binding transcriptional regulator GbsR (MarR family)
MPQEKIAYSKKSKQRHLAEPLDQLTIEIIDFFTQLSALLGLPRSVAAIYGLLFSSVRPLALSEVIDRLRISKGSASVGLNRLLRLGAARQTYAIGRRATHFEAVADLGGVIARLLRERVVPALGGSPTWLEEAERMANRLPNAQRKSVNSRIRELQNWQSKVRHLSRLAEKTLTDGNSHNAQPRTQTDQ